MKYIDVNRLKEKIYAEDTVSLARGSLPEFDQGCHYAFLTVLSRWTKNSDPGWNAVGMVWPLVLMCIPFITVILFVEKIINKYGYKED